MRLLVEGIRIAWHALWTNKLRTFLTLLGNIVGIMAVIAVVSLLGGVDDYMRQEVADEGTSVFSIERVDFLKGITDFDAFLDAMRHNPRLTHDDVDWLRDRLEYAARVTGRLRASPTVMAYDKQISGLTVSGVDAEYPFVEDLELFAGRHLTPVEVSERAQVVVIGWDVYTGLLEPRNPIGEYIRIDRRHFRVIGVVADRGSLLGSSRNRFAYIPHGTFGKLFGSGYDTTIQVQARDLRDMDLAIEEATVAMRIRHRLRPADKNDFFVSTSQQLIDLWKQISQGVMLALIALVSISLVVGGIVLMNTMLVAVTERTREVGVRKALGARRGTIVWQFLVESAALSVFGGVIGMLIGFGIAGAVSQFSPLPYVINLGIVAIAFAITVTIGLVFGTYPAVKAARLDPVAALRSE